MSMRSPALAILLLAAAAIPAVAQTGARLSGRVVERGSDSGIAGATIETGSRQVLSDFEGRFVIDELPLGTHSVAIKAYGYSPREVSVRLTGDTSIVVPLDPAPISLDSLLVEGRTITVRGEVYERGDDRGLLDVEIRVEPDHESYTNSAGRFKLEDIPAGPPLRFSVRGFGFLPIESVLSAFEDTTLVIHLEADSVAQRMIQQQVERIENRARPHATAVMPALDREYLLRNRNATALDIVQTRYGLFLGRIKCILIDDRQSYNGLAELAHFLPDELERVEVLLRGVMLRIYTRDYLRERLGQAGKLPTPVYVPGSPPFCR
jgi:hypothetical protein